MQLPLAAAHSVQSVLALAAAIDTTVSDKQHATHSPYQPATVPEGKNTTRRYTKIVDVHYTCVCASE